MLRLAVLTPDTMFIFVLHKLFSWWLNLKHNSLFNIYFILLIWKYLLVKKSAFSLPQFYHDPSIMLSKDLSKL